MHSSPADGCSFQDQKCAFFRVNIIYISSAAAKCLRSFLRRHAYTAAAIQNFFLYLGDVFQQIIIQLAGKFLHVLFFFRAD